MTTKWKQFSGQWTVTQAAQAKGAGTWPTLPGAPTIGTATAAFQSATVAFTAPANAGYPTTLSYTATSSPGGLTGTGSASPITVTGLTNGTEYTFTVTATNDTGTGPASAASNAVTPGAVGYLYTWGNNDKGQLGLNKTTSQSTPLKVGTDNTWTSTGWVSNVTNKVLHAVKAGEMWWLGGDSENGQGGTGLNEFVSFQKSSPTQVGALSNWSQVGSIAESVLALKEDGTLWAWGRNFYGELGQNNTASTSSPVQIGSLTTWAYIGPGAGNSYAIKTDGTLWWWGSGNNGSSGTNLGSNRKSSPVQIGSDTNWAKISIEGNNEGVIALKTNGTMWAWGGNSQGQLGLNKNTNVSSPTQIGALTTWAEIDRGQAENCHFAIKTDGTLWAWGYGATGRLGNNTNNTFYSSPIQIGALTNWRSVTEGASTTLAIKTDNTLWNWGYVATTGNVSSPVQLGSDTDWYAVTNGGNSYAGSAIKGS